MSPPPAARDAWPPLPLDAWQGAYQALHMRTQIVGKTRLALSPMENHWWQVALYLTARGLTTSPMPAGARTLEVELDFLDHRVVLQTSDGERRELPLRDESVAAFYAGYLVALDELGVTAPLWPVPVEVAEAVPFPEQRDEMPYDADAAARCWTILASVDRALKRFRGRFLGKCSPVHFWWGSFDIACTRFSGARAPRHPGGVPNLADRVAREAYSHACISAGWWPGTPGGYAEPAFYAYAYPEPPGCREATIGPGGAGYHVPLSEWLLPYEAVRTAADPESMVAEFLDSTYSVAATLGGWDRAAVERGDEPDPLGAALASAPPRRTA